MGFRGVGALWDAERIDESADRLGRWLSHTRHDQRDSKIDRTPDGSDAFGAGWMIKVKVSSESSDLLEAGDYDKIVEDEG